MNKSTKRKIRKLIYIAKQTVLAIVTLCIFTFGLIYASKMDYEYDFGTETHIASEVTE